MTAATEELHPAEFHPALRASRRALQRFDAMRELRDRDDRVKHLTKIGMSAEEIGATVGLTKRTVARRRALPALPQRPRLYDGGSVSDERVEDLEDAADLALYLATVLREEDPTVVWGALARLDHRKLQELAVIALAAIPVDTATADELLAWVDALAVKE